MKKILIIMLCLTSTGIWAQSSEFGIKGGLNYGSTGDINGFDEAREDFPDLKNGESKAGYHFGVFGKFGISGVFIQPELIYTKLTTDYGAFDYDLNKIDLPVLLGVDILGPLNVKAGPSFQYITNNEIENGTFKIGNVDKDITVGYQLGAGLNLGNLGIDVRYEGAFTDNTAFSETAEENFSIDSRPSQWILSLSIAL
ncbi:outer membrane beta-barrel protein [Zunongwangia sp. HRR-M8]|uniref:outer membrane beta-barrel protein n=1 Tax=Zunongwangia sp. HRR-M8 TaxID=3015170 RepID=UPI0022DDDDB7|nr:outer membrane beta-barrel protein [Zunongwangia sp. HRR-M8]WBL21577.1 PorT family protein [Zunongwangia sp. HRR-M8]